MSGMDRHEQADLLAAAITLVASVTAANAAHGTTFAVLVPRATFAALERALEQVAPARVAEQRDAREGRNDGRQVDRRE